MVSRKTTDLIALTAKKYLKLATGLKQPRFVDIARLQSF